jgi:hypothetical protein
VVCLGRLSNLLAFWRVDVALEDRTPLAELSPIFGDGLKDQAAAVWD